MTPEQIAAKMASGHSVYSPSGAEMTTTCEESLVLNALAEDDTSYEAAEGTVAHSMAELWIKSGERPDHLVGTTEELAGFEIPIDDEMLSFVGDFVDDCFEDAKTADHTFSEGHVDVSDLTPIPDQGGTMDFCAMWWQAMKIKDLKYGKEPVFAWYIDEAKPNLQLVIYAWGIFVEWDWLYNFQTIELEICQPRLPHVWSRHTLTREELIHWAGFVRDRWALTWTREATRTPSLRGCRWCRVRATCPALYLFMADEFDVFNDPETLVIEGEYKVLYDREAMALANERILDPIETPFPDLPKPEQLSTAALAKLLRYRKFMENFFNSVSEELLSRAVSREEDIPWWKVVESRTLRKNVDDEEYIVDFLESKGLKRKDLYTKPKLKSPAQIEKVLHEKLKLSLGDAKRLLEDGGLTVKPPGRKTLAPTSDNRLALEKDGDVFDSWEDE